VATRRRFLELLLKSVTYRCINKGLPASAVDLGSKSKVLYALNLRDCIAVLLTDRLR
jgi:hypothetical protein